MNATNSNGHDAITEGLNRRLAEAWQSLWDNFVDPREPFWDDRGEWMALGSGAGTTADAMLPYASELELADIRRQCRALAGGNEFAINGHENRISYLVGSGHTYRAAVKKGHAAPAELKQRAQDVLDDFVFHNQWHRRQQEIVRRHDRDGEVFLRFFVTDGGETRPLRRARTSRHARGSGRRSGSGLWNSNRSRRRGNATGLLR